MASAEKVTRARVVTLPADFNEWDNDEAPAVLPDNFTDFDLAGESTPMAKPPVMREVPQSAALPAAAASKSAKPNREKMDHAKGKSRVVAQPVVDKDNSDRKIEKKTRIQPKLVIAAASAALVLLVVLLASHSRPSNKPATPIPTVAQISQPSNPTTQVRPTNDKPSAIKPSAVMPETTPTIANTPHAYVDPGLMNNQLNAPTHITADMKRHPQQQEAPPSSGFNAAGMESMGGSGVGNAFGKKNTQVVKAEAPRKISLPTSVAMSMLQRAPAPAYPALAKMGRVDGVVSMQVTISKNGTIESVRPVGGAAVLQQAAVDAVKTWRFRQFTVDNQPVEVETTLSVVFKLH
jgi:protein TonB